MTTEIDWEQARLNGGSYCFKRDNGGRFCGRAERWAGHHLTAPADVCHEYLSISSVFELVDVIVGTEDPLEEALRTADQRITMLEDLLVKANDIIETPYYDISSDQIAAMHTIHAEATNIYCKRQLIMERLLDHEN